MYDRIIIGAGIYGLYSALFCAKRKEKVLVLEYESSVFARATYANQARVHMGYHYPRSLSTALKSAHYFERFYTDYRECILSEFNQIYATSREFSYTNAEQFKKFCDAAGIECLEINPKKYFKNNQCDGAFVTKEYTYDAYILRNMFLAQLREFSNVTIKCGCRIETIELDESKYLIKTNDGNTVSTKFLLNATYASTNQILEKMKEPLFEIKYELCEIILCDVNEELRKIGLTVMDGPFFSIMPFGKTGLHSLTSVSFTPHSTSYDALPYFRCMDECNRGFCNREHLGNCNLCTAKPKTAFAYMSGLAHKYILDSYDFKYRESLFSMKPILKSAEIDDSRPTVVRVHTKNPTFVSVLSGKVNTIFDLDEVLQNE